MSDDDLLRRQLESARGAVVDADDEARAQSVARRANRMGYAAQGTAGAAVVLGVTGLVLRF